MRSIPFSEGELRWVFPDLTGQEEVRVLLERADEQIRQLAAVFHIRPGWTGHGLEYIQGNLRADLMGCAEPSDVSFLAELSSVPAFAEGSDDVTSRVSRLSCGVSVGGWRWQIHLPVCQSGL